MRQSLAPVAIFAYRRTAHLAKALDALDRCSEFAKSPVFIYSDGPRTPDVTNDVEAVRQLIRARRRPNMTVVERSSNLGLARSIISETSALCESFGKVIVIEDDLLVSPATLTWFNSALAQYESEPDVWQVSAHQFSVPEFSTRPDGMFLRLTTSWGWATWARSWKRFDPLATGWESLKLDAKLRAQFDVGGYPYANMLQKQMEGRIDSWAVRWWWTVFNSGGLSLYPPRSLVANIGFDSTATHRRFGLFRGNSNSSGAKLEPVCPSFPRQVRLDSADQASLANALAKTTSRFLTGRLASVLGRF